MLCFLATILLLLWPVIGIVGSIIGGAAYGLLSPMFATFKAVGEGTTDKFFHCIYVCLNVVTTSVFNSVMLYKSNLKHSQIVTVSSY